MPDTVAPDDFTHSIYVEPGDALIWGQLTAEPATLIEALDAQCGTLGGIRAFVGMSLGEALGPESGDHIDLSFAGGASTNHRFARDGRLNTLPVHLSRIPHHIAAGDIPCDIALIHASGDAGKGLNLALSADYMGAAVTQARTVIAELNDKLPETYGETAIDLDAVDAVVATSRPPPIFAPPPPGDAERSIGALIAKLVPDRATLQMGIGAIPDAVLEAMAHKRDLSVHSGLVTDKVVDLIERGVVTNRYKEIDEGQTVAAILYGTDRLYRWSHRNQALSLRSVAHTHASEVLARFDRFFAINTAIEVDMTGQINGEMASGRPVGLIGGQVDFGRAGLASPGGRSIIALRSTARGGKVSTIVPRLADGVVTTARSDVDVVVTEYGMAELAGIPVFERARRLVAIAHPDFRNELLSSLDRLF